VPEYFVSVEKVNSVDCTIYAPSKDELVMRIDYGGLLLDGYQYCQ